MKNLLAGAVAVSAIALLSACDDDHPPHKNSQVGTPQGQQQQVIYANLDACLADAKDMDTVKACRDGYAAAMAKMAEAPKYQSVASCEEVYGPGNCVPRGSVVHDGGGGGWFVPLMMGYMIGGGFGHGAAYYPVYVDRSGTTYAGGYRGASGPIVSSPSWQGQAPAAVKPSSSVERGGFGRTAMTSATSSSGG